MSLLEFFKSKPLLRDIVILFGLTLIFHWPIFSSGFFNTDDGSLLIIRAGAFFKSFSDLHIPVRLTENLNYGYGYPIFNFFYPGFFYLTEAFHLFGLGLVESVKSSILVLGFLGTFGMYLLSHRVTANRLASLTAATFFLFSPYHIIDLYRRGSFGELFALAIIPFVTLGIFNYLKHKSRTSFLLAVFSTVLVIIGHNSLSLILIPFAYIFGLVFSGFNKLSIKRLVSIAIFSTLLSSTFWLPAIFETRYTVQSQVQISDYVRHFPSLSSLLIDVPFLASMLRTGSNAFPISTFLILFSIVSVWFFFKDHHNKPWRIKMLTSLAVIAVSIYFVTPLSGMFWKYFALDKLVQFPWRFLSLTIFATSIMIGLTVSYIKKPNKVLFILPVLILLFYLPQIIVTKNSNPDEYYLTNDSTTVNQSELSTLWFDRNTNMRQPELIKADKTFQVQNLKHKTQSITFEINLENSALITVNKMYFPHWTLKINGKIKPIEYKSNGLINFDVDKGKNFIELNFVDTKLRIFANTVSLFSVIILLFLFIRKRI